MEIRPIRTEDDYHAALAEASLLMAAEAGTTAGDRLDVLATLIEAYEGQHYPIEAPDPIAAIQFMMEQKGLERRDLEPAIGGARPRVRDPQPQASVNPADDPRACNAPRFACRYIDQTLSDRHGGIGR